jgi:hypothetical protein
MNDFWTRNVKTKNNRYIDIRGYVQHIYYVIVVIELSQSCHFPDLMNNSYNFNLIKGNLS